LHHVKPKFQYSSTNPKPIAFFSPSPASYANPISSGLASRVIFIKLHRRKNLHTLNDKIGFNSTFTRSQEKLRLKKQTLSETADKFSVRRRNKEMCLRKIQTTFGRDPVLDNKIGKSIELKSCVAVDLICKTHICSGKPCIEHRSNPVLIIKVYRCPVHLQDSYLASHCSPWQTNIIYRYW
jgi:hypothetical protein